MFTKVSDKLILLLSEIFMSNRPEFFLKICNKVSARVKIFFSRQEVIYSFNNKSDHLMRFVHGK